MPKRTLGDLAAMVCDLADAARLSNDWGPPLAAALVRAHEAAVADDVGCEDCDKPAFQPQSPSRWRLAPRNKEPMQVGCRSNIRPWLQFLVLAKPPQRTVWGGKRMFWPRCRPLDQFLRLYPWEPTWHQRPAFVWPWPGPEVTPLRGRFVMAVVNAFLLIRAAPASSMPPVWMMPDRETSLSDGSLVPQIPATLVRDLIGYSGPVWAAVPRNWVTWTRGLASMGVVDVVCHRALWAKRSPKEAWALKLEVRMAVHIRNIKISPAWTDDSITSLSMGGLGRNTEILLNCYFAIALAIFTLAQLPDRYAPWRGGFVGLALWLMFQTNYLGGVLIAGFGGGYPIAFIAKNNLANCIGILVKNTAALASGNYFRHYFVLLLPELILAAGDFLSRLPRQGAIRAQCAVWLLLLSLSLSVVQTGNTLWKGLTAYEAWIAGEPFDRHAEIAHDVIEIIKTNNISRSDVSLLVYRYSSITYYLTGAKPLTQYPFYGTNANLQHSKAFGFEPAPEMARIFASKPQFVVVLDLEDVWVEAANTILRRKLETEYSLVKRDRFRRRFVYLSVREDLSLINWRADNRKITLQHGYLPEPQEVAHIAQGSR